MAGFKIDGLDKLQRDLKRMEQNARKLNGKHSIPFDKLFTKSFMKKYTRYSSIDDLLEAGGFQAKDDKEFDAIPTKELNAHIAKVTKFKSWEDMLDEAVQQYIDDQFGF